MESKGDMKRRVATWTGQSWMKHGSSHSLSHLHGVIANLRLPADEHRMLQPLDFNIAPAVFITFEVSLLYLSYW